jgi:hypothetical protein
MHWVRSYTPIISSRHIAAPTAAPQSQSAQVVPGMRGGVPGAVEPGAVETETPTTAGGLA